MTLGIDPGSTTGFAIINRGSLLYCRQFAKAKAISELHCIIKSYRPTKAIVEQPRMGVMYNTERMARMGKAGQIRLAQNIGQNIEFTNMLKRECEQAGLKVVLVHPTRKSTKWDHNVWARAFNWQGERLPGEHGRDAATTAYLNEGR